MVHLLFVNDCADGLPRLSLMTTLTVYPFFGNHCVIGKRGIVVHCARVQPMHHSVLPEEGGVVPQGRSLSSRQALTRKDRIAKRNLRLARARTGGTLLPQPPKRTNSDQTAYPSSCYFCGVKSVAVFMRLFEKKQSTFGKEYFIIFAACILGCTAFFIYRAIAFCLVKGI